MLTVLLNGTLLLNYLQTVQRSMKLNEESISLKHVDMSLTLKSTSKMGPRSNC